MKWGLTVVGAILKFIACDILTKAPRSIFFKPSIPAKSIPLNPSITWVTVAVEPSVLTLHTEEDHIFSILEYPVPYSLVKYIDSIFRGSIIVCNPFNTQLDWIDFKAVKPPKFNIALSANDIS